jgi:hypothetical protein
MYRKISPPRRPGEGNKYQPTSFVEISRRAKIKKRENEIEKEERENQFVANVQRVLKRVECHIIR